MNTLEAKVENGKIPANKQKMLKKKKITKWKFKTKNTRIKKKEFT